MIERVNNSFGPSAKEYKTFVLATYVPLLIIQFIISCSVIKIFFDMSNKKYICHIKKVEEKAVVFDYHSSDDDDDEFEEEEKKEKELTSDKHPFVKYILTFPYLFPIILLCLFIIEFVEVIILIISLYIYFFNGNHSETSIGYIESCISLFFYGLVDRYPSGSTVNVTAIWTNNPVFWNVITGIIALVKLLIYHYVAVLSFLIYKKGVCKNYKIIGTLLFVKLIINTITMICNCFLWQFTVGMPIIPRKNFDSLFYVSCIQLILTMIDLFFLSS